MSRTNRQFLSNVFRHITSRVPYYSGVLSSHIQKTGTSIGSFRNTLRECQLLWSSCYRDFSAHKAGSATSNLHAQLQNSEVSRSTVHKASRGNQNLNWGWISQLRIIRCYHNKRVLFPMVYIVLFFFRKKGELEIWLNFSWINDEHDRRR